MGVERQQGSGDQLYLFEDLAPLRPGVGGDGGTGASVYEASQASTASGQARALTSNLMEEVRRCENLNRAHRRVKSNRGAPGVDEMTIHDLRDWPADRMKALIAPLLEVASLRLGILCACLRLMIPAGSRRGA